MSDWLGYVLLRLKYGVHGRFDEPPPPVKTDCCDVCGSLRLVKVKGCVRCEACGYKGDCNGW